MTFEDLDVWKKSKQLAVGVIQQTKSSKFSRDYPLKDQMQRAAISIPSNIAEGYAREGNKEKVHFLFISKGSAAELWTQIKIAGDLQILDRQTSADLCEQLDQIQRMLMGLINALRRSNIP